MADTEQQSEQRFVLYFPVRYAGHEPVWSGYDRFRFIEGRYDRFRFIDGRPALVACYSSNGVRVPGVIDAEPTLAAGRIDVGNASWVFESPLAAKDCLALVGQLLIDDGTTVLRYYREFSVIAGDGCVLGTFLSLAGSPEPAEVLAETGPGVRKGSPEPTTQVAAKSGSNRG